jgi:hypothetical protein
MSFMRPEAEAFLKRWAETAFSGAVLAVMLWVGGRMIWAGVMMGVVVLTVAIGAGFWFWTALARARLGASPLGPGVVIVDERRITYMGPETGAFVALDALTGIDILIDAGGVYAPSASWVLRTSEGAPLVVPTGAEGADQLMETFVALPGFSYDKVVAARSAPAGTRAVVWRRGAGSTASALASRIGSD